MKKINYVLLVMSMNILCSLTIKAQVAATNGDTSHVEATLKIEEPDFNFDVGQTVVINENTNTINNLPNSNKHLKDFYDEIDFNGDYASAVVAYVDKNGYYYQVSDATTKENISTLNAPLLKITKLRGVEYNHKTVIRVNNEKSKISTEPKELRCGFLAQEVETIMPEAVSTGSTGKKYINYQVMIPFLVEALKEQQTQIEKQVEQIKLLQAQMDEMHKSSSIK